MMNHKEILSSAVSILKDRADLYGSEEDLFERVSILYNVMTGQQLSPYDINVVMVCMKLARMRFDRRVADNYVDAINYMSFMGQFADIKNPVVPISKPAQSGAVMMPVTDEMEAEIKALADKFKPEPKAE
jgi:hypothetical protein